MPIQNKATAIGPNGLGPASLVTAPDFGCVQFEPGCAVCRGVPLTSVTYHFDGKRITYGCDAHPVKELTDA